MIACEAGGDIHLIETVTPYTADFDELRDVNHDERDRNYLPELKGSDLDIAKYDMVFVGYPVWATDVPQAVLSFLNEYDLSGKTVIPFCTHDGYGAGHSYQTIADASHAAVSLDGIAIEAKDVPNAQDTVSDWLANIGIHDLYRQKNYTEAVVSGKGDYVLALKGNQQLFHEEVRAYFEEDVLEQLKGKEGCYKKTVELEHGGRAIREYYITEEYRYYICNIGEDADEFERAARGHWGVEAKLHWHLDFTFRDDKNTSMGKTSAKNLQIMKKIALGILGLVKESYKMSMKRIRYELSLDYENEIEKMLSMLDMESVEKALSQKDKSVIK